MSDQLALWPTYLAAHLELTLLALLWGTCVSIPAGIWVVRHPRLEGPILGLVGLIQTIPSLALLAMMVPALAALSAALEATVGVTIRSIGVTPALIALSLYSMLPILRNTVTGMRSIDPALREAARGVGMTPSQQLWRVELPLALPTIVAGVRTATVWVVGMAVLSTPVGAPSLGNFIFTGLQTRNLHAIFVGCFGAAGLAMGLDGLVRAVEVGLRSRGRRPLLVMACLIWALLYGFVAAAYLPRAGSPAVYKIGGKPFTEQLVLAEILARQLQRQAGVRAEVLPSLGSTVIYDALKSGDVDAYVDYTGTLWAMGVGHGRGPNDRPPPPAELRAAIARDVARDAGGEVAAALGFANTYAIAMRRSDAAAAHLVTLADLAPVAPALRLGGDYEIFGRREWHRLRQVYGLHFAEERSMDPALMYAALEDPDSGVDAITAYSTDGRLTAMDLVTLADPKQALPPYDAVVLVGRRLRQDPQALAALSALAGRLSAPRMQQMNQAVTARAASVGAVAQAFVDGLEAAR